MIWAKAEKKRFFHRPRMAMMAFYTVGLCLLSLTAFAGTKSEGDYRITLKEAEQSIAEELMRKGVGDDIEATVIGRRSTEIVRRNVPVVMEILDLQVDRDNRRFNVTLAFSTEAVLHRPAQKLGNLTMAGRYEQMVEVPVVKYRLTSSDVIREKDIEWQKMPESRLDRDTILDMAELVEKSPVRGVMAGRAVKKDEIQHPPIVLRRAPVHMRYRSEYISISAIGTAMQDGAMGEKIKVRNDDSGIVLDARVIDKGRVEVNPPVIIN